MKRTSIFTLLMAILAAGHGVAGETVYRCEDGTGYLIKSQIPCPAGWAQVWRGSEKELAALLAEEKKKAEIAKNDAESARAKVEAEEAARRANSKWEYSEYKDKLSGKAVKLAKVLSSKPFSFGFPYRGSQYASLVLRKHPRFGEDVLLYIEQGQFMCKTDGCQATIRFDDSYSIPINAVGPDDNDTTVVFIRYPRFIANTRKANKVLIEATFYQEGKRVFEFDTSYLKWP